MATQLYRWYGISITDKEIPRCWPHVGHMLAIRTLLSGLLSIWNWFCEHMNDTYHMKLLEALSLDSMPKFCTFCDLLWSIGGGGVSI